MIAPATVPIPDTTELSTESTALVAKAAAVTISTETEYQAAGEFLKRVTALRKRVEEVFREPKSAADRAHKAVVKAEKDLLAGPAAAEKMVRLSMAVYLAEEERKRREAQARLMAEEQERARKAQQAEANALADAGDVEAGLAVLEQEPIAPVIELPAPKAEGISTRRRWVWEVVDVAKIHRDFLMVDSTKIGKMVTALGPDASDLVGGIRVTAEQTVVVR